MLFAKTLDKDDLINSSNDRDDFILGNQDKQEYKFIKELVNKLNHEDHSNYN
jgi:hypothetical protein